MAAKPAAGNSWAGTSRDALPQQLDPAEDRGDHHEHRARNALQDVVVENLVAMLVGFSAPSPGVGPSGPEFARRSGWCVGASPIAQLVHFCTAIHMTQICAA